MLPSLRHSFALVAAAAALVGCGRSPALADAYSPSVWISLVDGQDKLSVWLGTNATPGLTGQCDAIPGLAVTVDGAPATLMKPVEFGRPTTTASGALTRHVVPWSSGRMWMSNARTT